MQDIGLSPQLPAPGRLEGKAAPWEHEGFPAAFWLLLSRHFISGPPFNTASRMRARVKPMFQEQMCLPHSHIYCQETGPHLCPVLQGPLFTKGLPRSYFWALSTPSQALSFPSDEWTCQATHHNHWLPLTFSLDFLMSLTFHGSNFPSILPFPHIHQPWPMRISPSPLSRITER